MTASSLEEGHIVWRDERGRWVRSIRNAALLDARTCEDALAQTTEGPAKVIGIYAVVVRKGSMPVPTTIRERIRAFGPTVHPQFSTELTL